MTKKYPKCFLKEAWLDCGTRFCETVRDAKGGTRLEYSVKFSYQRLFIDSRKEEYRPSFCDVNAMVFPKSMTPKFRMTQEYCPERGRVLSVTQKFLLPSAWWGAVFPLVAAILFFNWWGFGPQVVESSSSPQLVAWLLVALAVHTLMNLPKKKGFRLRLTDSDLSYDDNWFHNAKWHEESLGFTRESITVFRLAEVRDFSDLCCHPHPRLKVWRGIAIQTAGEQGEEARIVEFLSSEDCETLLAHLARFWPEKSGLGAPNRDSSI